MRHWICWLRDNCEELLATAALLALAIFMLANAFPVLAAPQMRSEEECNLFADMALVARALAEQKIPEQQSLAVLASVYDSANHPKRVEMALLLNAAASKSKTPAADFARAFNMVCVMGRGNIDGFFGGAV